ncbi:MAG: BREX-1 system adenine-specific DNA-methyltransferase PglX [Ruminococcus sp.]|nr:BREX-1 system adenine-specific DNA-methyltransferase PglX [Ruminococcus sp.]
MNKSAVKNFAVYARTALINAVTQKAFEYEVTENGKNDSALLTVNGKALTQNEINQRKQLINRINLNGFRQTVEEVAYTWFNRFIALRFMEVNGYLPSRIRVFSDHNNDFKPEILKDALNVNIEGIDRQYVLELLDKQQIDTLYKYLLIRQCNALNHGLPYMFEKLDSWTELLFPNNLLRKDSVIAKMINDIPEDDWKNQVQIIGWLYQYYNSEPKDKVFADLKKNIKINSVTIPFATQLFTPDWIVRYMVENSLGRLWLDGHEDFDKSEWLYYLDEPEQLENVRIQLDKIRNDCKNMRPEDIKFIDTCMGSGHVLVYAFDVLIQIYKSCGWSARDAVESILKNNLYGLDIDRRAYQLAYFSVIMKARQYNRRILDLAIQPHLANFSDVMGIDTGLLSGNLKSFAGQFAYADTIGSLMTVTTFDGLAEEVADFSDSFGISQYQLDMMLEIYNILGQKYDVVCTNPPYMGSKGMDKTLSDFVRKNFPDSKSDLSTCFMEKCENLTKSGGYYSMINIPVWMFLSSYEKLRKKINIHNTYVNKIHFGRGVFGSDFGTTAFVISKNHIPDYTGVYRRLFEKQGAVDSIEQKEKWFFENMGYYTARQENFSKITGSPVAYWLSDNFIKAFENGISISELGTPKQGMSTCDVNRFIKLWYEVNIEDTNIIDNLNYSKWIRYNKGGDYRKWYGNRDSVVLWNENGDLLKSNNALLRNRDSYFKNFIAWTKISSAGTGFRNFEDNFLFDGAGGSLFIDNEEFKLYYLALLNCIVSDKILQLISPTLNFNESHIGNIPVIIDENEKPNVDKLVQENIEISKKDWDSFETSWDFETHPLI